MGRVTLSFRMIFKQVLEDLKSFHKALLDPEHKDVFNSLKRVWSREMAAMIYVHGQIPVVFDLMLLTALIDNRKEIMKLEEEISLIDTEVSDLDKNTQ